jgi:hypothetical protein
VNVEMVTYIKAIKRKEMRKKWILGLFNNAVLTRGYKRFPYVVIFQVPSQR